MNKADMYAATPAHSSLAYFRWAVQNPPSDPTTSFKGKTVLITWANTGLGFEAALKFAKLGASKIIFGVRSLERGEAARAKIYAALTSRFDLDLIEIIKLDMSDFSSVKEFAKQVSSTSPNIHIAVLNAGMAPIVYNTSDHGWEASLQINVLSTAYLAISLLPKLKETAKSCGRPAHLELVTSNGHGDVSFDSVHDDANILFKVNKKEKFNVLSQYSISKLLAMYLVSEIAARVSSSDVTVISVCPGLCKSDIARDGSWIVRKIDAAWKYFAARATEEGSRTLVSGTLLEKSAHGCYWTNDRISEPSLLVTSPEGRAMSAKFWKELETELEKYEPGVMGHLA